MDTWKDLFCPLTAEWFTSRFGSPTEPQLAAWPAIAQGKNVLVAAPTGSGKTLAAFMVCLDQLLRQWQQGELQDGMSVLYLSPLKALSNDIERNLQTPLAELNSLAMSKGLGELPIRVAVRTGDTTAAERQAMLKKPPHILVTTPESLYLLVTSVKGRERLAGIRTVIVDEIHALARDKRGSHLSLSLERLEMLSNHRPVRIGLSATQRPIEEIARFLVGCCNQYLATSDHQSVDGMTNDQAPMTNGSACTSPPSQLAISNQQSATQDLAPLRVAANSNPQSEIINLKSEIDCTIIDAGHVRDLDIAVEVPPSELAAVCSLDQWGQVYEELARQINSHRSTLVFVNTRRMAERIAHHLTEMLGEEAVASHHGSLSRQIRHDAEQRLKAGKLKAIVATASLEMGIDIGYIDLVLQIGSPRAISAFLQRVGRSGHSLGKLPKGRLFPLTRDELLECMALVRSVRGRILDKIQIPEAPLDILAQQIVAAASCEDLDETELFDRFRRAYSYRNLERKDFDAVLAILAEGNKPGAKLGAYLHRDRIHGKLRARKGARLAAITNGGAIPEAAEYRVMTEGEQTFVGNVDEHFAVDSSPGDVFLLGGTSWRIAAIRGSEVIVNDAQGAPPTIPFWFGESPGRTLELSHEISRLRSDIGERIVNRSSENETYSENELPFGNADIAWLSGECSVNDWGAGQALRYVAAEQAALGIVPNGQDVVFERFFDESGGMQLVIHAPFGARVNRAWGLAMRKRFCRSFDFELQAAADDDGVLLSLGPQHSFPIEQLFSMLGPHNGQELLEQALLVAPMFQVRWRWNVTRALAVLRRRGDKRVPPHIQRFRSDDLLASAFPETVGCLENHHGDVVIPDHPYVQQTMHDCLHEAMDVTAWLGILQEVKDGTIKFHARDTREASPFAHELINAQPYAFLDGAPLEERRTRAVHTRRSLSVEDFRDLSRLDPAAIAQVSDEAWPIARDLEELHDTLMNLIVLHAYELKSWSGLFEQLVAHRRAARAYLADGTEFCFAAERLAMVRSIYATARIEPQIVLPGDLDVEIESHVARVELVRGRISHSGPITPEALAALLSLETNQVAAALEALEGQGMVVRGQFTSDAWSRGEAGRNSEWCERRLLARIHRLTMAGLRRRIAPVEPEDYLCYLAEHHGLAGSPERDGPLSVRAVVHQLQGFELAAGAWERHVLSPRVKNYDPRWLDELFLGGEVVWGRLDSPKRTETTGKSLGALTRTVPLSILLRDDLPWLLPAERNDLSSNLRENTQIVFELLQQRGALFLQELKTRSGLLPTQMEESLRELSAVGLITSDTFAAVRSMVGDKSKSGSSRHRTRNLHAGAGRWSLFPGLVDPVERTARLEHWCRLLMDRYGVVFRDLLTREHAAPSWSELVPVFRKLELRGEVRGGRFVAQTAGEQYALESSITKLREARERRQDEVASSDRWCVVSAVDPLNLIGIVGSQPRITANAKTAFILHRGRCVAVKQSGQIEFWEALSGDQQFVMRRALQIGRRETKSSREIVGVRSRA